MVYAALCLLVRSKPPVLDSQVLDHLVSVQRSDFNRQLQGETSDTLSVDVFFLVGVLGVCHRKGSQYA